MKLTKKHVDIIVIALFLSSPIFAYFDVIFIGQAGFWEYLKVCFVESGIFAMGYVLGKGVMK